MAYGNESERTTRFAFLCGTLLILGAFITIIKTDACANTPSSCKDEFYELEVNGRTGATCDPGARAEVVNPPNAPKPGVLCHCIKTERNIPVPPPNP